MPDFASIDMLVWFAYAVAALGAVAVYLGMPKAGRPRRRGLALLFMMLAAGAFCITMHRVLSEAANHIAFVLLALFALGGAARMVTHPRPVYSALYFIVVVLATTAMLVLAGAEFLAIALVIVYAGAILVTYVFVIMLSQQSGASASRLQDAVDYDRAAREPAWAVMAGFILTATIAGVIVSRPWPAYDAARAAKLADENTFQLGMWLMTDMAVSVQLAAVLLLVAMVGAIAIARKNLPQDLQEARRPLGEVGRHVAPF